MTSPSTTEPAVTPSILIDRAAGFGKTFAASAVRRDLDRILPHAEIAAIRASGLLAARLPAPFGAGASILDINRILVELSRGDPNIAQAIMPHIAFVEKLLISGDAADRARFFPLIARGDLFSGAAAERAGRVVGEMHTRLAADGTGGFRLTGHKDYATGSLFAQWLYVSAIRDDGTTIQVVIPTDRAGVTIHDDWTGFGQRSTSSGSVVFEDVVVAGGEILRSSANAGKRSYFGATSQLNHAALDTGIALAALDDAVLYARTRARPVPEAGVTAAPQDPHVIHAVGKIAATARAALALTERAARALDACISAHAEGRADDDLLVETSIAVAEAKAVASDACLRASEQLFRVGGASATSRDLGLDRHWRNARTHTLHDPVSWKYHAIGDYLLNDKKPPINAKY